MISNSSSSSGALLDEIMRMSARPAFLQSVALAPSLPGPGATGAGATGGLATAVADTPPPESRSGCCSVALASRTLFNRAMKPLPDGR